MAVYTCPICKSSVAVVTAALKSDDEGGQKKGMVKCGVCKEWFDPRKPPTT